VSDEALARLEQVFDAALSGKFERSNDQSRPYGTKA